jgi:hypothetical protein|tara:strand:- start:1043 stop:1273 length:231 start_codon:yes stop_codon:yes gene_type:complete
MAKNRLEKLADELMRLSPEEGQQLGLIMRSRMMPEVARQQGLLQQPTPQMAQMGKRPNQMAMPTTRDAAMRGLLKG